MIPSIYEGEIEFQANMEAKENIKKIKLKTNYF